MRLYRLIWCILWILSIIGISNYGGASSYGLFFALTLLPLISLLYLITAYFQFKIHQKLRSTDIICGQPMPYSLLLRNEGFFGISSIRLKLFSDFSQITDISENTEYSLLPGDEFRYETTLICKYRGEYTVGVEQVIFVDFLRLFSFRYTLSKKLHATVYPKVTELTKITHIVPNQATTQPQNSSIHKEPDIVVRDYIHGDSLHQIHWKTTARTGKLQVRNDIDETGKEITILFDTHRFGKNKSEYLPLESRILEVVLSLSKFFVKQNTHLSVYYGENGLQKQTTDDARSFDYLYIQLSKITFTTNEHFTIFFQECYDKGLFLHTKTVIAVLHELDAELLQIAKLLMLNGTTVLLYIITDDDMSKHMMEESLEKNIIVLPTFAEWEELV